MSAQVLSMHENGCDPKDWRNNYLEWLTTALDKMESGAAMDKLWDITGAILENRCEMLGRMALGLTESRYRDLLDQERHTCPGCGKTLKSRGKHRREIETRIGRIGLPYFYCTACTRGFYPLDEALSLSSGVKQYDVQDLETWLGSELPFETASEAYKRCTGQSASSQSVHSATNRMAEALEILDVSPGKEEIEDKIKEVRGERFRRPVMMLAVDGGTPPRARSPAPVRARGVRESGRRPKGFAST